MTMIEEAKKALEKAVAEALSKGLLIELPTGHARRREQLAFWAQFGQQNPVFNSAPTAMRPDAKEWLFFAKFVELWGYFWVKPDGTVGDFSETGRMRYWI
jgi:hypothetical protein